MAFDTLIELNSLISDGFLMSKIVYLFKNRKDLRLIENIDEKQQDILANALKYIELTKKGREFVLEKKIVENLDKSLEIFNISLNALIQSGENLTIERFNEIINLCEVQIKDSLKFTRLVDENADISMEFFESIRKYLVKEADKINIEEQSIL